MHFAVDPRVWFTPCLSLWGAVCLKTMFFGTSVNVGMTLAKPRMTLAFVVDVYQNVARLYQTSHDLAKCHITLALVVVV